MNFEGRIDQHQRALRLGWQLPAQAGITIRFLDTDGPQTQHFDAQRLGLCREQIRGHGYGEMFRSGIPTLRLALLSFPSWRGGHALLGQNPNGGPARQNDSGLNRRRPHPASDRRPAAPGLERSGDAARKPSVGLDKHRTPRRALLVRAALACFRESPRR